MPTERLRRAGHNMRMGQLSLHGNCRRERRRSARRAGNGRKRIQGGGVYAWTSSGTIIPPFPLYTDVDAQAGPTVADIDNDGKVEVIASSNQDLDLTKGVEKFRGSLTSGILLRRIARPPRHGRIFITMAAMRAGSRAAAWRSASLPSERAANQLPATRTYTLTLTNIDGARCGSRAWPLTASVPTGWSASLSSSNPTVPPGSTVHVTITVTAPAGTQQGSYPVRVTVVGDALHPPIEKSATFLLDLTAPTVIITRPASGASYLQNSDVFASYSCSDAHIQSCVGTVAVGNRIPTATTGTKSFTVTATDRAGNVQSKTVNYTVVAQNPSYTLSPTTLAFGKRALYLASSAKTISLNNNGDVALPITSIAISGTNLSQFTQTNNCGATRAGRQPLHDLGEVQADQHGGEDGERQSNGRGRSRNQDRRVVRHRREVRVRRLPDSACLRQRDSKHDKCGADRRDQQYRLGRIADQLDHAYGHHRRAVRQDQ